MKIECDICYEDLSGKEVEYHYSRNHDGLPSFSVILLSLRESNEIIRKMKKKLDEMNCVHDYF